MCGIMGYIGEENAADIVIDGLESLEYRGYDSAGIAISDGKNLQIKKVVGSPENLRNEAVGIMGCVGIGHTRWATHGVPDCINAHPHISEKGLFTVVHNGIIENYRELKTQLQKDGIKFKSETDTEVIAHLLEKLYDGDLKGTVGRVMQKLEGSYALSILCEDYPDVIVCTKLSSPLFVGTATDSGYVASDVAVLADKAEKIYRLNDNEIGLLKKDSFRVYDTDGCRIRKNQIRIKSCDKSDGKNGYSHYMLKEIYEQPSAVRNTLAEITDNDGKIKFSSVHLSAEKLKNINNIIFVACGSAYHAGLTGAYLCEKLLRKSSQALVASEFRYKHPHLDISTLVIIISQSGETADTLAALRIAKENGAETISIVNVENSTIAQESDNLIMTRAGREIAVATTKAYSAQLTVIYSLIISLAQKSATIDKATAKKYIDELKAIPAKIEKILSNADYIKSFAEKINNAKYICFIGRYFDYCCCVEASLKLKEISYVQCEAYPAGELKHGTISLIDGKSLIIALCACNETKSKTASNINEVIARGADVITVSTENADIVIPETDDIFVPLIEIVPMQLMAYHTAVLRGCEIDKPKNLAKSVTVE